MLKRLTIPDQKNPVASAKRLWLRYGIALLGILAALMTAHILHIREIEVGARDAEIINMSGKQRMLSQRLILLADATSERPDSHSKRMEFAAALEDFKQAHGKLVLASKDYPSARAVYAPGNSKGLDAWSDNFAHDLERIQISLSQSPGDPQHTAELDEITTLALGPLLTRLNNAVSAFETDATARVARLGQQQRVSLAIAVLILLLEAVFIFLPAQVIVSRAIALLQIKSRELERKNRDLQSLSEKFEHSAYHDPLTGLPNRKRLYAELESRAISEKDENSRTCVMHIDLDRFKEINDTLGHQAGDDVLKKSAEAMKSKVRREDLICRVGGDEFVLLARLADDRAALSQAQVLAESLISRICEPIVIEGQRFSVGASIGYTFLGEPYSGFEHAIEDADIALYEAKALGRGQAVAFHQALRQGVERRFALARDLERGIEANEFVAHLQPIVSLKTGRVEGLEALARWEHPEQGTILPPDFIETAEEIGVIQALDLQVLQSGLDSLSILIRRGYENLTLNFNASTKSISSPAFASNVMSALLVHGIAPEAIRIEVNEGALIKGADDELGRSLQGLADHGIGVCVDNFGAGYSSLPLMGRMAFSSVKLSRQILPQLSDERARQLATSIIGFARGMKLEIFVEGIGGAESLATLRNMGVEYAQSFDLAVPMCLQDLSTWMEDSENLFADALPTRGPVHLVANNTSATA